MLNRKRWLWVFGICTVVALFTSTQLYLKMMTSNPSWAKMFFVQFLAWQTWGMLSFLIFWLGKKFRIDRQSYFRGLLIHIPMAILIVLLYLLFYTTISTFFQSGGYIQDSFTANFKAFFLKLFHWHFFIYMAIIGLVHALEYYTELKSREVEAVNLEKELALSQLNALRAQLAPHFLFNTLNNVVSTIKQKKEEVAVSMLIKLSEFLRMTILESRQEQIKLKEELDFVKRYLEIEQFRHKEMQVCFSISEKTYDIFVPGFILQPIVENAIKHGISRSTTAKKMEIRTELLPNRLKILIYNEGPSPLMRDRLKQGIGLINTLKRLEKTYQGRASFQLQAVANGALVELLLPLSPSI